MVYSTFASLNEQIVCCEKCPRLVHFRKNAPARASFKTETYWRKPVPGHGDPKAWLFILGLAPAAQGGNRTGRIFTGDESARFLTNALYLEGFANQPTSEARNDGLQLSGCYLSASVKCVPPQNKPLPSEFSSCFSYFENELFLLKEAKVVLALGKGAFDTYLKFLKMKGAKSPFPRFGHGVRTQFSSFPILYGSFHPSPQNTYTGKLTEKMFRGLLQEIKNERM